MFGSSGGEGARNLKSRKLHPIKMNDVALTLQIGDNDMIQIYFHFLHIITDVIPGV